MTDTITLPRSVVEQALEALNASMPHNNDMDEDWPSHIAARRALRAALEQPQVEQEPVAWLREDGKLTLNDGGMFSGNWKPLYTQPQLRQPLTDEQIKLLIPDGDEWKYEVGFAEATEFARAIEAAHGIGGDA